MRFLADSLQATRFLHSLDAWIQTAENWKSRLFFELTSNTFEVIIQREHTRLSNSRTTVHSTSTSRKAKMQTFSEKQEIRRYKVGNEIAAGLDNVPLLRIKPEKSIDHAPANRYCTYFEAPQLGCSRFVLWDVRIITISRTAHGRTTVAFVRCAKSLQRGLCQYIQPFSNHLLSTSCPRYSRKR